MFKNRKLKKSCNNIKEKHQESMELVEDYDLLTIAEERMENVKDSDFIINQEVMDEFEIKQSDLDDIEVEIK